MSDQPREVDVFINWVPFVVKGPACSSWYAVLDGVQHGQVHSSPEKAATDFLITKGFKPNFIYGVKK